MNRAWLVPDGRPRRRMRTSRPSTREARGNRTAVSDRGAVSITRLEMSYLIRILTPGSGPFHCVPDLKAGRNSDGWAHSWAQCGSTRRINAIESGHISSIVIPGQQNLADTQFLQTIVGK